MDRHVLRTRRPLGTLILSAGLIAVVAPPAVAIGPLKQLQQQAQGVLPPTKIDPPKFNPPKIEPPKFRPPQFDPPKVTPAKLPPAQTQVGPVRNVVPPKLDLGKAVAASGTARGIAGQTRGPNLGQLNTSPSPIDLRKLDPSRNLSGLVAPDKIPQISIPTIQMRKSTPAQVGGPSGPFGTTTSVGDKAGPSGKRNGNTSRTLITPGAEIPVDLNPQPQQPSKPSGPPLVILFNGNNRRPADPRPDRERPNLIVTPPAQPVPPVTPVAPPTVVVADATPLAATEVTPAANAVEIIELKRGTAAAAGLQVGDVVLAVNQRRVRNFDAFVTALKGQQAITVSYYRPRAEKLDTVEVAVVDDRIGVVMEDLAVNVAEDAPPTEAAATNAVEVTGMSKGPAADAGLQIGDVILAVGTTRVRTLPEFQRTLTTPGKTEVVFYRPKAEAVQTTTVAIVNDSIGVVATALQVGLDEGELAEELEKVGTGK